MKKKRYEKPELSFESFELAANIASCSSSNPPSTSTDFACDFYGTISTGDVPVEDEACYGVPYGDSNVHYS